MSNDFPSRQLDKFMLRLPDGMREQIGAAARANRRTMTAEIIRRLEDSFNSSVNVPNVISEQDIIQMIIDTHTIVTKMQEAGSTAPHQSDGVLSRLPKLKPSLRVKT